MERLLRAIKAYFRIDYAQRVNTEIVSEKLSFYGGVSYSSELNDIFVCCYDLVEKDFDHVTWVKSEQPIDPEKILEQESDYLIKYLFSLHRAEKFADGTIASAKAKGALDTCLLSILLKSETNTHYWQNLSGLELGKYSEYLAKIEFLKYKFQVFQTEVDDRGIDFIAKAKSSFFEIQVKSVRLKTTSYVFFTQSELFYLRESLYVCLLIYKEALSPEIYLIPSFDLAKENGIFVFREYSPESKSKPEWGIQLSKKHLSKLVPYKIELALTKIKVSI